MKRRSAILLKVPATALLALSTMLLVCGPARVLEYPSRPVTIVVPYEAGGGVDRVARLVAEQLHQTWKSPVVVENRPGANGNIGAEYVSRSSPDGYTLLYSPPGPLVINKLLYRKLPYDSDEFVPISLIVISPNVLVVNPRVQAKSVQELIDHAKAKPGELNYGSPGNGGTPHLTAEMFKMETETSIVHVPYKGTSSLMTSLLGGVVDLTFSELGNVLPHVRANTLRALGVASEKRSPSLSDIPTMSETLPGFLSATWSGLVAPRGTPPDIPQRIYESIAVSFKASDVVANTLEAAHLEAVVSTPKGMAEKIASERGRWEKVIKTTGVKIN